MAWVRLLQRLRLRSRRHLDRKRLLLVGLLVAGLVLHYNTGTPGYQNGYLHHNKAMSETEAGDWQDIGHPHFNFSIYTAYSFDSGKGFHEVTITAAHKAFKEDTFKCQFHWDNGNSSTVSGRLDPLSRYRFNPRFAGNFIHCPISPHSTMPVSVSVLLGNQTESAARLKIQYQTIPSDEKSYKYQFSVCLMPFYNNNGSINAFHFIEWFEFHKLMGVQQFTFFNNTIHPELNCVLNNLKNNAQEAGALVNVNLWHTYPFQIRANQRHGNGMAISLQDCLFRHKGVSKYLLLVDYDEFITPRLERGLRNYSDLIQYLEKNSTQKFGDYVFRNGFFNIGNKNIRNQKIDDTCGQLKSVEYQYNVCRALLMTSMVRRQEYERFPSRQKGIARPERVKLAGVHTNDLLPGFVRRQVPPEVAFLRHYRNWTGVVYEKLTTRLDEVNNKELEIQLAKNVARTLTKVLKKCDLKWS